MWQGEDVVSMQNKHRHRIDRGQELSHVKFQSNRATLILAPQAKTGRDRVMTSFLRKTNTTFVCDRCQRIPIPIFCAIGRYRFLAPQAKTERGRVMTSFLRKTDIAIAHGRCQSIPIPTFGAIEALHIEFSNFGRHRSRTRGHMGLTRINADNMIQLPNNRSQEMNNRSPPSRTKGAEPRTIGAREPKMGLTGVEPLF